MTRPWNDPKNADNFKGVIPVFVNPVLAERRDADGFGLSHLAANSWVLSANKSMKLGDITDGTANTILFGEVNSNFQPWGHPVNWRDPSLGLNQVPQGFGGVFKQGVLFVMADGSVRTLKADISLSVLKALSTPRGGEKIDEADFAP